MKFAKTRKDTLNIWLTGTGRRGKVNDSLLNTWECQWQDKFVSAPNQHNSFYCSLAEWNNHITDILRDRRLDNYDFTNENHRKALFRYYTRLLLIFSEIMTDFQDFLIDAFKQDIKGVRSYLSSSELPFSCSDMFDYINNLCKHKVGKKEGVKYHYINHHIDYYFADSEFQKPERMLTIREERVVDNTGYQFIEVPALKSIIQQILYAYKVTDEMLSNKYSENSDKLKKYEIIIP